MDSKNNQINEIPKRQIPCKFCKKMIDGNNLHEHFIINHFPQLTSKMKAKHAGLLCVKKIRNIIDNTYDVKLLSSVVYNNADSFEADEDWFQEFQKLMTRMLMLLDQRQK